MAVAGREVSDGTEVSSRAARRLHGEGGHQPPQVSLGAGSPAREEEIARLHPERPPDAIETVRFTVPSEPGGTAEILGTGPEAAPKVVELLREIRVVAS